MTENKRFRLGYVCGDYGLIDDDKWIDLHSMSENSEKNVKLCINKMNELAEENEQLKHNNKMISMKMSEVSTKYRLLKEFSDDTNPNEAVKTVLHELMMITKEYR